MPTDAPVRTAPSYATAWRVVLVVISVLLNVLLIGIIAGHLLTARRAFRRDALVPGANVRALPIEERRRFMVAMAAHREAIRAARTEQHRARRAAATDIGAPALDAEKVKADLAALREANGALQAAANDGLVEALGILSPTSRAALVTPKRPQPTAAP